MKLCKKQKFFASRLQRPVAARNDVIAKKIASRLFQNRSGRPEDPGMTSSLKKLLADCFKTVADGPKTGLLAARAISSANELGLSIRCL